jgi:probable HAF family extracellular repeat protein
MAIPLVGSSRVLFAVAIAACGMCTGVASAQSFAGLGYMTDGTESYARGVSNNGVVTGFGFIPPANGPATGFRAFGWTQPAGMVNLGTLPSGNYSAGRAVSADGSTLVGWSGTAASDRAFRYTGGVMTDLGTLQNMWGSAAFDVSGNGQVVVGYCGTPTFKRAFRWTSGVMTDLGVPNGGGWVSSIAHGVSGDGSVVVGYATKSQANSSYAFRWVGGTMTNLGTLKNGAFSEAWATNSNGSVVVGTSDSKQGRRAFRWVGNTMTDLGTLPGQPQSHGWSVSGDGLKVVGYCSNGSVEVSPSSGSNLSTGRAFLWTSAGMVDLNTYLPTLGINLSGWTLREARGISPDGTTIVGWGWHNGQPEAWVARLVP